MNFLVTVKKKAQIFSETSTIHKTVTWLDLQEGS